MTGRVDQLNVMLSPRQKRGGSADGDAALPLLVHPVEDGGPIVDFAHVAGDAGVEQDALRQSRLARVDVRGNADVAQTGEFHGTRAEEAPRRVPLPLSMGLTSYQR